MNALIGVKNFLSFLNDNWTLIIVIAGLCVALGRKVKSYISLSNDEKIEIAKTQISESILKMITDAEEDYDDWVNAGAIKRSQVIKKIFEDYPILNNMTNQGEVIKWIDVEINNALKTLRTIVEENSKRDTETNKQ